MDTSLKTFVKPLELSCLRCFVNQWDSSKLYILETAKVLRLSRKSQPCQISALQHAWKEGDDYNSTCCVFTGLSLMNKLFGSFANQIQSMARCKRISENILSKVLSLFSKTTPVWQNRKKINSQTSPTSDCKYKVMQKRLLYKSTKYVSKIGFILAR